MRRATSRMDNAAAPLASTMSAAARKARSRSSSRLCSLRRPMLFSLFPGAQPTRLLSAVQLQGKLSAVQLEGALHAKHSLDGHGWLGLVSLGMLVDVPWVRAPPPRGVELAGGVSLRPRRRPAGRGGSPAGAADPRRRELPAGERPGGAL